MTEAISQPEEKIQPVRVVPQREAMEEVARAGEVDDIVEFRAFYTREVVLFGAVAGPEDGDVVVLLHGFPDCWLSWTHQIRALAEAGYRVIAPDQRGYHFSEKPSGAAAYTLDKLGGDIVDIVDAAGVDSAHLVGHDWGGAVSWWLAKHRGERFRTVTIANCPHQGVMMKSLMFNNFRQMMRSWYIGFFQLPAIPQAVLRAGNYRALAKTLRSLAENPDAFSDAEIEAYRQVWSQEGSLTAMVNWYRAGRVSMFSGRSSKSQSENGGSAEQDESSTRRSKITVPLQIIWGEQDKALDVSLVEPSADRCEDATIHWVPEAGHWVQRDCPKKFNDELLGFVEAFGE